ncbi:helix-turn-helix domain-containing protein [Chitinolyticbacter meiyuanensis]|uniref:helix-turn-helix domain-containing protein n=1 Tax=Chitinolyticbacter meiyuanensis TaxID=682798 RepID=UPI0011E60676|nr:RodZ domain-containing protein [Chitinolyticbacter meiyuanensis]
MSEHYESTPAPAPVPPQGVGRRLRARREELGLTVEQVGAQLKLGKKQIDAIEIDHFESLPGNTFARGFVRNYAKLLGLDAGPLLTDLEQLLPKERPQSALPAVKEEVGFNVGGGISSASSGGFAGALVGLATFAAVVGGVWWYLQQPVSPQLDVVPNQVAVMPELTVASAASSVVASAPAVVASAPIVAAASPAAAVTPTLTPASAGGDELRFVAQGETWVQVRDATGQRVLSEVIPAGSERTVTGKRPFSIKVGNAPQTRLFLKGQPVDLVQYTNVNVATFELK